MHDAVLVRDDAERGVGVVAVQHDLVVEAVAADDGADRIARDHVVLHAGFLGGEVEPGLLAPFIEIGAIGHFGAQLVPRLFADEGNVRPSVAHVDIVCHL